jgi:hypothetical protein
MNQQMFTLLQVESTKISHNGTLFKVMFIQDSVLFRVQFKQVSLYEGTPPSTPEEKRKRPITPPPSEQTTSESLSSPIER